MVGLVACALLLCVLFIFLRATGRITFDDGVVLPAIEQLVIRPRDRWLFEPQADQFSGLRDGAGRVPVPCPPRSDRLAVIFSFGQSNATNISPELRAAPNSVVNFNPFDGQCYPAIDPLLGTGGSGGAIWTVLGSRLVEDGIYDAVILVPGAVGGSSINRWSNPRDLGARIAWFGEAMRRANVRVTHVLFVQGSADQYAAPRYARLRPSEFGPFGGADGHSMRSERYIDHFLQVMVLLQEAGMEAPVYVAVSTRCGQVIADKGGPVAAAQRELPRRHRAIHLGPDIDAMPETAFSLDKCHLSSPGVAMVADEWRSILRGQRH